MKTYRYPKAHWLLIGVIFLLILYGCIKTAQKSEAPEPTSKPSELPPPKTPPSQGESEPSGKLAPSPTDLPPPAPTKILPPDETFFIHTVKWSGETVFIIAAWYTGDRDNWRAIAEAMVGENPKVNIHLIRIGDKIPVPQSLMKVRDPMPKDFVDSFYSKSKPDKGRPKPPPPKVPEDDIPLYPPKESSK